MAAFPAYFSEVKDVEGDLLMGLLGACGASWFVQSVFIRFDVCFPLPLFVVVDPKRKILIFPTRN